MTKILVADTCKSSLVMTTEIFKDRIPGCGVAIVGTGEECVNGASTEKFDMIIADFDLPDTDGVNLTHVLRKVYDGPILLTAFPEKIVEEAIQEELFSYRDSTSWIPKPVKFDVLEKKIEAFILQ
jgi:two-component system sensor histidine kinase TorS